MLRVSVLVVVVLGCLLTSSVCRAQVFYVKPSQPPNTTCPGELCHTLNYYAQNAASLLSGKSNVTLLFVEGVHLLTEPTFEVFETDSVTLSALTEFINVTVMLSTGSDMNFTLVDDLHLSNLVVVADILCPGNNIPGNSINTTLVRRVYHSNVTVFCCDFHLQMIHEFQLYHSTYYYAGINMYNFDEIDNVILMLSECYLYSGSNINISLSSSFNGSITNSSGFIISVHVINRDQGFFSLTIRDCVNRFEDVGEVSVIVSEAPLMLFEVILENNHFDTEHFYFSALNNADFEGFLCVKNCSFHFSDISSQSFFSNISMDLSSFNDTSSVYFRSAKECTVRNVSFNNSNFNVVGPSTVLIDNCRFENSVDVYDSPFVMSEVRLLIVNETVFKNNQGYNGGALYLFNSRLYLTHNSVLVFDNNSAIDKGGAVYVESPMDERLSLYGDSPISFNCTFSLKYNVSDGSKPDNSIVFKDNSAANGGSNIYGTSLKSDCLVSPDGRNHSYEVQADIFEFDHDLKINKLISSVSSDPKRVCLCDDNRIPMCGNLSQYNNVAPGETITVNLALVGGDFGVTVGSVYATLLQYYCVRQYDCVWLNNITTKTISSAECFHEEYVIHSDNDNSSMFLFLSSDRINNNFNYDIMSRGWYNDSIRRYEENKEIDYYLATASIILHITLQKCPKGLILNKKKASCQCIQTLTDVGVTKCVILDGEVWITRSGAIWVSNSEVIDNETGVVAYKYCPFDYCTAKEFAVQLRNPNSQCAFSHSGVLCGGCSPNLSLALGSPRCLPCSDDGHVAFFIPFAIAGLLLVLFIKLLDLTITKGAVNGLLLYANILWTNQSIFFPHAIRSSSSVFRFFVTFVAWLNLDLGIETCFIQGLDMYWKTWLQFLFPLYIWSIAGLIILACRYSDKATKLFGNNSVHVLATLVLLSYSKLLRTIITSLGFAILDLYPSGTRVVWLADGNVPYFGVRHSFLLIAAILALIIFVLPYTVTILLVPWLRKCGNISWVNKLKPFFDAHYGPLKDNHQYWIGLTLLVRVILAITNVTIQAIGPTVNLFVTITLSSLLLYVVGFSHKKRYLSILEASFVANVIIVGGGFLYLSNQNAFAGVSVGIAFLTFLLIICAQGYTQLKTLCRCKTVHREYENINGVNDSKTESVPPTHSVVSLYDNTTQDYYPLRESLLESDAH
ncbi:uncharacterized protein LOC135338748 [Halichondria panicea]|uniref:uncharacterized protein LOC135338748 n=1 Tax=Halichondria panicea TaxID=6063 RepID=UPI00312B46A7